MKDLKERLLDCLPIFAFLVYWLTAGLLSALAAGDARLPRLWPVTLPVLVFMGAGLYRIFSAGR
jgi:hypothetical protein